MRQNQNNLPSGQMVEGLLKSVAKQMGKTPEQLREELKNGKVANPDVQKLLGDKDELEKFMASPQVQKLMEELKKK